jgi:hypothetical protein
MHTHNMIIPSGAAPPSLIKLLNWSSPLSFFCLPQQGERLATAVFYSWKPDDTIRLWYNRRSDNSCGGVGFVLEMRAQNVQNALAQWHYCWYTFEKSRKKLSIKYSVFCHNYNKTLVDFLINDSHIKTIKSFVLKFSMPRIILSIDKEPNNHQVLVTRWILLVVNIILVFILHLFLLPAMTVFLGNLYQTVLRTIFSNLYFFNNIGFLNLSFFTFKMCKFCCSCIWTHFWPTVDFISYQTAAVF